MKIVILSLLLCLTTSVLAVVTPKITFIKSPNFSSRGGNHIHGIILHHTGDNALKSTLSWFKSKKSKVSAHYVIDRNGDIYQLVKDEYKAWHAGKSKLYGYKDVNSVTIGIELVSKGNGDFTEAQYKAVANLCKELKKKYHIKNKMIVGHNFISPGRMIDPEGFNWKKFFKLVNSK